MKLTAKFYVFDCGCFIRPCDAPKYRFVYFCPHHGTTTKMVSRIFTCEICGREVRGGVVGQSIRYCKECKLTGRRRRRRQRKGIEKKPAPPLGKVGQRHAVVYAREAARPSPLGRTKAGLVEDAWECSPTTGR